MADLNANHVNPFLIAATKILKETCLIETKIGKPSVKPMVSTHDMYIIMIGITGEMSGQAMIAFEYSIACDIASKMCMMPIEKMDELSNSAICELGNMIMGNAATVFSTKGIGIDITPPTLCTGSISISSSFTTNICIPIIYEDNKIIEVHVAVKDNH
ncbi:chemotaxis protein CheX [Anaeromicropila populeti]|uniref:Chemotaxis protein CheX n=1 Tax=Anaeromicropila populeti TaxID=37658 RepID=A0A1I6IYP7_9FIRM|nr:chemotaxis protein CheX [Anaeromicropila populeti]SFR71865.1 chemotaxis protein CheX [Anaeromicropila populeti]